MNGDSGTSTPHTTQLRALLFTDLCDSTLLVERMGDAAAAELFQDHDRLVMALQQRWNGQQIDRSDGLFMLFERPVDALGFGLDYQRGLQALGGKRNILLRARIGLHVGEVLLWNNSAESIALGAKPVEVEGLAKPMAARLMQLAQPGQFLVSATAESMVRRAAGDLGEATQGLKWKSFGRWRFKGVAQSMEVFGLHDPATRGLGRPRQTAKASRDIPFWRQPLVMTAEVTLAAALLVGGWLLTRPQPAIAFAERDWVVVGDLRNLTGETLLDGSTQQALRISLEQSRYVNVISDLKARSVLQQMRASLDAPLDANNASEIAQRVGARVVLMPTLSEAGGRLRLSVGVVDPASRATLAVESADGRGLESLLASTDDVVARLRGRLGETLVQVEKDSTPLPAVTTGSLDALRSYSIGQKLYARGDYPGALAMFQQAVELDPEFALAWMAQVRAHFAVDDLSGAMQTLDTAKSLKRRLPPREALYLDAWAATLRDRGQASDAWRRLSSLYPDYFAAQYNAAIWLYAENRFDESLPYARHAADPRFELSNVAHDLLGRILVARGDVTGARQALKRAIDGGRIGSNRYLGSAEASLRNYDAAESLLDRASPSRHVAIERISMAVDRQQWTHAAQIARDGARQFTDAPGFDQLVMLVPLATALWGAGDDDATRAQLRHNVDSAFLRVDNRGLADSGDDAMVALASALISIRMGDTALAERVLAHLAKINDVTRQPPVAETMAVVGASVATRQGKPDEALVLLAPWLTGQASFQTRVAAMDANVAKGANAAALVQADYLASNRGRAYAELDCGYCMQPLNVLDSNRAAGMAATLRRRPEPTAAAITVP